MYFTFGSSVCKHKRIRAHILHTRIHRFSRKSPANMRGLSGFRQYSHDPTSLALFARRMSACGGAVVVIFNNKPGHLHGDKSSDSSCAKRIKGGGRGFRGGVTSWYDTFCHLVALSRKSLLPTSRLAGPDSCRQPGSLGH